MTDKEKPKKVFLAIRLTEATKSAMKKLKIHPRETYEDIIRRIVLKEVEK